MTLLLLIECQINSFSNGTIVPLTNGVLAMGDSKMRNMFTALLRVQDRERKQIVTGLMNKK